MAVTLNRPTLINVPAFDATSPYTFIFTVQGTTAQITENKLIIRDQENNNIVYEEKQETFKYQHTLAENKLTNGKYYNATITIYDGAGNESPPSIPIQFWCYSQPTISFTNLPDNNIIQNASFNFEFQYNQAESEKLNTYIVNLYNSFGTIISTSDVQYASDGTPPFNGNYLVAGLENATVYYIEIIATTINGTQVTTGRIELKVQYLRPDLFTLIELKNNCDEGYISVRSNIILIDGESNPDPPIYIDDKEVDLTAPDSWVEWNEGYSISGDMLTRIWFRKPNPYSEILRFSNANGQTISLSYMQGYEDVNSQEIQSFVEVHVTSVEGVEYYIFSNFIDTLSDTEYYNVWLKRVGNIYQVQLQKV